MPVIRIHDVVTLSDLLRAAGPAVLESTWRCDFAQCISWGDSDEADEALYDEYNAGNEIAGADFTALAARTRQIIDGTFWATHPVRGRWLGLRAIDSSFWEVESPSAEVLEPFAARFRDVRTPG